MDALFRIIMNVRSVIGSKKLYVYLKEQIGDICGTIFSFSQWDIFSRAVEKEDTKYDRGRNVNVAIKTITAGDINVLRNIAGPILISTFRKRIYKGKACLAALFNNFVIAYIWVYYKEG